ncbi:MAG: hypothetical protein ABSE73_00560 [Planctomycetota bacterium]
MFDEVKQDGTIPTALKGLRNLIASAKGGLEFLKAYVASEESKR